MVKIARFFKVAVIGAALLLTVIPSGDAVSGDMPAGIAEGEKLLEEGRFGEAMAALEPMLGESLENGVKARVHFLLGRSLHGKAFAAINDKRVDGKVKFKDIDPQQVTELKSAAEHFLQVIEMGSDTDLLPDAYFMLGKVWDYDCLQKFGKSRDSYAKAAEMDPDSEMGKEATGCVERLETYFTSHGSGHGN